MDTEPHMVLQDPSNVLSNGGPDAPRPPTVPEVKAAADAVRAEEAAAAANAGEETSEKGESSTEDSLPLPPISGHDEGSIIPSDEVLTPVDGVVTPEDVETPELVEADASEAISVEPKAEETINEESPEAEETPVSHEVTDSVAVEGSEEAEAVEGSEKEAEAVEGSEEEAEAVEGSEEEAEAVKAEAEEDSPIEIPDENPTVGSQPSESGEEEELPDNVVEALAAAAVAAVEMDAMDPPPGTPPMGAEGVTNDVPLVLSPEGSEGKADVGESAPPHPIIPKLDFSSLGAAGFGVIPGLGADTEREQALDEAYAEKAVEKAAVASGSMGVRIADPPISGVSTGIAEPPLEDSEPFCFPHSQRKVSLGAVPHGSGIAGHRGSLAGDAKDVQASVIGRGRRESVLQVMLATSSPFLDTMGDGAVAVPEIGLNERVPRYTATPRAGSTFVRSRTRIIDVDTGAVAEEGTWGGVSERKVGGAVVVPHPPPTPRDSMDHISTTTPAIEHHTFAHGIRPVSTRTGTAGARFVGSSREFGAPARNTPVVGENTGAATERKSIAHEMGLVVEEDPDAPPKDTAGFQELSNYGMRALKTARIHTQREYSQQLTLSGAQHPQNTLAQTGRRHVPQNQSFSGGGAVSGAGGVGGVGGGSTVSGPTFATDNPTPPSGAATARTSRGGLSGTGLVFVGGSGGSGARRVFVSGFAGRGGDVHMNALSRVPVPPERLAPDSVLLLSRFGVTASDGSALSMQNRGGPAGNNGRGKRGIMSTVEGEDDSDSLEPTITSVDQLPPREADVPHNSATATKGTWSFRVVSRKHLQDNEAQAREAGPPVGHYRPKMNTIEPRVKIADFRKPPVYAPSVTGRFSGARGAASPRSRSYSPPVEAPSREPTSTVPTTAPPTAEEKPATIVLPAIPGAEKRGGSWGFKTTPRPANLPSTITSQLDYDVNETPVRKRVPAALIRSRVEGPMTIRGVGTSIDRVYDVRDGVTRPRTNRIIPMEKLGPAHDLKAGGAASGRSAPDTVYDASRGEALTTPRTRPAPDFKKTLSRDAAVAAASGAAGSMSSSSLVEPRVPYDPVPGEMLTSRRPKAATMRGRARSPPKIPDTNDLMYDTTNTYVSSRNRTPPPPDFSRSLRSVGQPRGERPAAASYSPRNIPSIDALSRSPRVPTFDMSLQYSGRLGV